MAMFYLPNGPNERALLRAVAVDMHLRAEAYYSRGGDRVARFCAAGGPRGKGDGAN